MSELESKFETLLRADDAHEMSYLANPIKQEFRDGLDGALSLTKEKDRSIAFLGPKYSFSHQAVQKYFASYVEIAKTTYKAVLEAVVFGEATFGLVPIENSTDGTITEVADLWKEDESILTFKQVEMLVKISCLGISSLDKIKKVVSYSHIFGQCKNWLAKNLPDAEYVPLRSTSETVESMLLDETYAVLCSIDMIKGDNIQVLGENIQDYQFNTTRFLCLGSQEFVAEIIYQLAKSEMRFWIRLNLTEHEIARYSISKIFDNLAQKHITVSNIFSRPRPVDESLPSKYYSKFARVFFVELIGRTIQLKESLVDIQNNLHHGKCQFMGLL